MSVGFSSATTGCGSRFSHAVSLCRFSLGSEVARSVGRTTGVSDALFVVATGEDSCVCVCVEDDAVVVPVWRMDCVAATRSSSEAGRGAVFPDGATCVTVPDWDNSVRCPVALLVTTMSCPVIRLAMTEVSLMPTLTERSVPRMPMVAWGVVTLKASGFFLTIIPVTMRETPDVTSISNAASSPFSSNANSAIVMREDGATETSVSSEKMIWAFPVASVAIVSLKRTGIFSSRGMRPPLRSAQQPGATLMILPISESARAGETDASINIQRLNNVSAKRIFILFLLFFSKRARGLYYASGSGEGKARAAETDAVGKGINPCSVRKCCRRGSALHQRHRRLQDRNAFRIPQKWYGWPYPMATGPYSNAWRQGRRIRRRRR